MKILLFIIIFIKYNLVYSSSVNFISVGDLGGITLGGKYLINANKTINSIKLHIEKNSSKFIINTGDNFYNCGIKNINDKKINEKYLSIFNTLGVDWYNTLGNHDYGYNVSAQLELNKKISYWILPDKYYIRRITINKTTINLIILDTTPCISKYMNNPYNKTSYNCQFYENIVLENCTIQYEWLKRKLIYIDKREWIIIIGHHPINKLSINKFINLIDKYADLYINGHNHLLNHYIYNKHSKYITTGAGSMIISTNDFNKYNNSSDVKWSKKITGYTGHFIKKNKLKTLFYDDNGQILYSFTVNK